ncbi:MAG TPA: acyltransferase, partial [Pyrinomonadaceae bacterium]|nr:acyltransferase [Pyrinomonadaceae bacterium]
SEKRVPELDGIRGLAIFLVLIWHFVGITVYGPGLPNAISRVTSLTWSGVDLFFVLSGFLIAGILIDNRGALNYFRAFYIRRVCRIFPLYYAWLILILLGVLFVHVSTLDRFFNNFFPVASYLTFTQNFFIAKWTDFRTPLLAMTWSLAVEEQFYLLLPLTIFLVPPRKLPAVLLTFIVAAPVLRTTLYFLYPNHYFAPHVLMPCRADSLLLGALLAYGVRKPDWFRRMQAWRFQIYALLALLFAVIVLFVTFDVTQGRSLMNTIGLSVFALFYTAILTIIVTQKDGLFAKIARWPTLRFLGKLAYGLYIFNLGALTVSHRFFLDQEPEANSWAGRAVTAFAIAVTFAAAMTSWHLLEQPILKLGHRFKYRRATGAGAPSAAPILHEIRPDPATANT